MNEYIKNIIKESLSEYLDKEYMAPFYHYMKGHRMSSFIYPSDSEFLEILEEDPYMTMNYAQEYFMDNDEYEDLYDKLVSMEENEETENCPNVIAQNIKREDITDFMSFLQKKIPVEDQPTWGTMQGNELIKNKWLIHFSDNAENIAEYGFVRGNDDMTKLHLTTYRSNYDRSYPGYIFAYDCDEFERYYIARSGLPKYGKEAVMFKANGVKSYHYGDQEPQVVVYGPSAKDFVYLRWEENEYNEMDETWEDVWCVKNLKTGKIIYKNTDLPKVVSWVEQNYEQYRKAIVEPNKHMKGLYGSDVWDERKKYDMKGYRKPKSQWEESIEHEISTYLNEQYNRIDEDIDEIRNQLKIPFDDNYGGMKSNYEHFIDYLEHYGKVGQLPPAKITIEDVVTDFFKDKGNNERLNITLSELLEEYDFAYDLYKLFFENYRGRIPELVKPEFQDDGNLFVELINEEVHYYDVFNEEGKELLFQFGINYMYEKTNFPYNVKTNERNLIYVERMVQIKGMGNYMNHNTIDLYSGKTNDEIATGKDVPLNRGDYFEELCKKFRGHLGNCWSWDRGQSYCGHGGTDLLIKAWVDPSKINVNSSIKLNLYSMNKEAEIYLNNGTHVEVFELEMADVFNGNFDKQVKIPLEKPLICFA